MKELLEHLEIDKYGDLKFKETGLMSVCPGPDDCLLFFLLTNN